MQASRLGFHPSRYPPTAIRYYLLYAASVAFQAASMDGLQALEIELAERLSEVLHKAVPSLNEQQGEELGIYMAKNRDVFARAFKSQPDALSELINAPAEPVEKAEATEPDETPAKPAKAAKAPK